MSDNNKGTKREWEVCLDGCPYTFETSPPSEADPRDFDWTQVNLEALGWQVTPHSIVRIADTAGAIDWSGGAMVGSEWIPLVAVDKDGGTNG